MPDSAICILLSAVQNEALPPITTKTFRIFLIRSNKIKQEKKTGQFMKKNYRGPEDL